VGDVTLVEPLLQFMLSIIEAHRGISLFSHRQQEQQQARAAHCASIMTKIADRWSVFVFAAHRLLARIRPDLLHIPASTSSIVDTSTCLSSCLKALGLDALLVLSSPPSFSSSSSTSSPLEDRLRQITTAWLSRCSNDSSANTTTDASSAISQRAVCHLPQRGPLRLLSLPSSYTQFHSLVLSIAHSQPYQPPALARTQGRSLTHMEYPGVCLVCGQVLDGCGGGVLTAHTNRCHAGMCVFFLLQDCQILLMHHERACYLPGPYLDEYGEKHRLSRQKPLKLDEKRYEALRQLFSLHQLPTRVVESRSTSQRVIILGHY